MSGASISRECDDEPPGSPAANVRRNTKGNLAMFATRTMQSAVSVRKSIRTAAFETLENRAMKSATLDAGVLSITGSDDRDVINVYRSAITSQIIVEQNGAVQSFAPAAVTKLRITAMGGDDFIQSTVAKPAIIDGGDGNDYIRSGSGNDTILGGAGDDQIYGGDGNDTLAGQDGNDYIAGEGGNDHIDGGFGDDKMNGGSGTDLIDYSARFGNVYVNLDAQGDWTQDPAALTAGESFEADTLIGFEQANGGAGNDTLIGSSQFACRLIGNAGSDYLISHHGGSYLAGNTGDDVLVSSNSFAGDELHGGSGNDTAFNVGGVDKVYGTEHLFLGGTTYPMTVASDLV
jgi:Ca2+-binding RTX toxin-like protein